MSAIDWSKSMIQEYEFYTVDVGTWKDAVKLNSITKYSIDWDYSKNTIGSAKIGCTENLGEQYIRAYMLATQNGYTYRRAMGTFLVLTPEDNFDGKISSWELDAYSPLIELTEGYPALGYTIPKGTNILQTAYELLSEHARAPVIKPVDSDDTVFSDFVAAPDETWLDYLTAFVEQANHRIMVTEMGEIVLNPIQETASLVPTSMYTTDNSSILLPSVKQTRDLYSIPNRIEVILSTSNTSLSAIAINDNPYSPTSVSARGRYIDHRVTSPALSGNPTQAQLNEYALALLKEVSTLEYTITYSHGFCETAIGEGVMLHYPEANIYHAKAKVINQNIDLVPGCIVQETAVYTTELL